MQRQTSAKAAPSRQRSFASTRISAPPVTPAVGRRAASDDWAKLHFVGIERKPSSGPSQVRGRAAFSRCGKGYAPPLLPDLTGSGSRATGRDGSMAPPNCDALGRPARAARNHLFPPWLSSGYNAKGAHHAHPQNLQSPRRTVHRDAEGHLFRREADPAGPAEDGQGSDVSRPQGGFRDSPGRDGKPGRTSEPDLRIDGTPRPRQNLRPRPSSITRSPATAR